MVDSDVVVSFVTAPGKQGDELDFTINFEFDNPTHGGWIVPGTNIANITAVAEGQAVPLTLPVTSFVEDLRFTSIEKIPEGDTSVDVANNLKVGNSNDRYEWLAQPGSTYRLFMEYPANAVVTDTTFLGWSIDQENTSAGVLCWIFNGVAAENGLFPSWHRLSGTATPKITFPSEHFSKGDECEIKVYSEYTLVGDTAPRINEAATNLKFKIVDPEVHLQENIFKGGNEGNVAVNIDDPNLLNRRNRTYSGIENGGNAPIPELRFVWENDTTGNKANPVRFTSAISEHLVKWVFTVEGGAEARTIVKYRGSGSIDVSDVLTLAEGEYLAKVEGYPLANDSIAALEADPTLEMRQLKVGFEVWYEVYYASWPGEAFPNGTPMKNNDQSVVDIRVEWENESKLGLHTAPAATQQGNLFTLRLDEKSSQTIVYRTHAPNPDLWLNLVPGQSTSFPPGSEVNLVLEVGNANSYSGGTWKEPVIGVILPNGIEFVTTEGLEVHQTTVGVSGVIQKGTAIVTAVTRGGHTAYEFRMPEISEVTSKDTIKIPLAVRIKDGTEEGTYYLDHYFGFPKTAGRLFAASDYEGGMSLVYPPDGSSQFQNSYYEDTLDLDANKETPYLKSQNGGQIKVAGKQVMLVDARVYNNEANGGAGEWQGVNNPNAQATVSLNGTGQFELEIKNQGNGYLGSIQLINNLPQAGDARGSQWTATLSALDVKVYDADGNDKTDEFHYDMHYCTLANPTLMGNGMHVEGDGYINNDATIDTAKSFFLWLGGPPYLPGGYKIVFTGTVKAPAGVTPGQVDAAAYNSFTANATFFADTNGNGAFYTQQFTPPAQKFILKNSVTTELTQGGFVFKDLDQDGVYTEGVDALYAGQTVELYSDDPTNPDNLVYATTTDANGQYSFTKLAGGTYFIKVALPEGTAYSFVTQGDGDTASHVDGTGVSGSYVLEAGVSQQITTNAGIQAASALTVQFCEGSETGTVQKTVTITNADTENSELVLPLDKTGAVTAGTAPFTLPAGYRIAQGTPESLDYTLSWDAPVATLNFVVEKITYTVIYEPGTHGTFGNDVNSNVPHGNATPAFGGATDGAGNPVGAIGYTFTGWSPEVTATVTADATYVAQWVAADGIPYKVEHYQQALNGTTYTLVDTDELTGTTDADIATLAPKTYEGFTYQSDSTTYESTGNTASTTVLTIAGDGSLVVKLYYARNTYDVTYEPGTHGSFTAETYADVQYEAATPGFAGATDGDGNPVGATGYTFTGWSPEVTDTVTASATYVAQWAADGYTLSFDAQGGSPTPADVTIVYNGNAVLPSKTDVAKTGYTLAGWQTNPAQSPVTEYADGGTYIHTIAGNVTLFAKWAANQYVVAFNANGGSGSMPEMPIHFDETKALTANAFTRAGYTFMGWALAPDATVVEYADGANYTMQSAETVVLYAVWQANSYTLSFDTKGGTPAPASQTLAMGTLATAPAQPTLEGYSFTGWYTTPEGGTLWNFATDTMPAQDITLHAGYSKNSYQVTYNYNGAGENDYRDVEFGALVFKPQDPTWAGYTFVGWLAEDGTLWNFETGTMPARNITLTAQWQPAQFTVTYLTYDGGTVVATYEVLPGSLVPYIEGPAVAGHHFMAWALAENTDICWNFYTPMPAKNLVLIALYDKNAPVEPPASSTSTPRTPVAPPASRTPVASSSSASSAASASSAPSVVSSAFVASSPVASSTSSTPVASSSASTTSIANGAVPTAGVKNTWSLLSLILAIVSGVLSLLVLVRLLTKNSQRTGSSRVWALLSAIAGIVAVVVLFIVSNFNNSMVFINHTTIIFAIILVVQLVLAVLMRVSNKNAEEEEQDEEA
ncbi:InlB B-repeat-containing protein [Ruminococcaceae bacterium OttesenSCG-928-A16]|nr:InlB B-repeat-containing protein [Ruminococcaceae bacterium OttesenSCG-928-A16]